MTSQTPPPDEEKIKVRAVRDFDPRQMGYRDKMKLKDFLKSQGLVKKKETVRVEISQYSDKAQVKKLIDFLRMAEEHCKVLPSVTSEKRQHPFENLEIPEQYDILYERELSFSEDNGNLREMGFPCQDNDANPTNESMSSENKHCATEEHTSENGKREDSSKMGDTEILEKKEFLFTDQGFMEKTTHLGLNESSETVSPYKCVLTFRRGDKMETIPPANIGDTEEWWSAMNLRDGETGFIPRTLVVIEKDQRALKTTINDLPMELLDVVLEKAFLFWILNILNFQRDEDVITALALVDFCWFQRITKRKFKTRIWLRLQDIFGKSRKSSAITRNNQIYLMENMIPNYNLIAALLSLNCITQLQSHSIQRQRSIQDKNAELLKVVGSFDKKQFTDFIKCFRQTEQKTVARIMENGGVTIKVEVTTSGGTCTESLDPSLLHQRICDLRNRTKPWSQQTDNLINQLRDEGIDILSSHLHRHTVVVWLWCFTQGGAENIQKLYESNQLRDIFAGFYNNRPSMFEANQPKRISINIDSCQLKKTVVMRPISVDFAERFAFGKSHRVLGVTKLRNEIYAVLESHGYVIYVFEDEHPFNLRNKIRMTEIPYCSDIASSERENCLYATDIRTNCVWKITIEAGGRHKVMKWLATDYLPFTLSVSGGRTSQLLVVNNASSKLMIYGPDAELLRSIQLPENIVGPIHAVETSFGNFIIIHMCELKEIVERKESVIPSSFAAVGPKAMKLFVVSELSRDGQVVVRRFIPSNEEQYLNLPSYLSLDSNGQVFVAEADNMRVILLDSELKWNKILRKRTGEKESMKRMPLRVCYDESKRQLIFAGDEIYVYNLSQN